MVFLCQGFHAVIHKNYYLHILQRLSVLLYSVPGYDDVVVLRASRVSDTNTTVSHRRMILPLLFRFANSLHISVFDSPVAQNSPLSSVKYYLTRILCERPIAYNMSKRKSYFDAGVAGYAIPLHQGRWKRWGFSDFDNRVVGESYRMIL